MKPAVAVFTYIFLAFNALAAANTITILAKDEVVRGEPFLVSFYIEKDVESFDISWQNIHRTVPAVHTKGLSYADLLLPAKYKESGEFTFNVAVKTPLDKVSASKIITVLDKEYTREELTVAPKYVTLSPTDADRVAKERVISQGVTHSFSNEQKWSLPFLRPLPGAVTGEFGSQRFFNGQERGMHAGLDLKAATGDPIYAAADGKVALTASFFYNGNCVYVDHGQGVITIYMHMSKILVNDGDIVNAGDLLGLAGASGRVTGPHLHLHLYVQGVAVDPAALLKLSNN